MFTPTSMSAQADPRTPRNSRAKRVLFAATAATALAAGLSATPAGAAPSTAAAGSYNIMIHHGAGFVADFCLLSTTSGNPLAACSGNKVAGESFRLGVIHSQGDDVWIDVNVVAGRDTKGIGLRGNHYCRVGGTAVNLKVDCWKSLAHYQQGALPDRVWG
ncbi:hypothetical protein ACF1G5_37245 [Streptomyces coeruleorubidus]|uniref:hypothetical protein n=1 Tax=Streptomyces coeruleorubidus TaxID=116188 RepID=UPI0036FE9793